jgi:hypothetical protein
MLTISNFKAEEPAAAIACGKNLSPYCNMSPLERMQS